MEPTEVAKALILGKFAKPLTEGLYSYKRLDEIKNYLARDLRVVSREAQQRFVVVIGPGLGLDATSTNVFGTLTPTIDNVLNYTLKAGYALQVGFNYGLVSSEWRKSAKSLYSSSLYALEKVIIEVESKDTSRLDDAKAVAKRLVDGLLSYVDDVYVEYSGHKSYYLGLWLPEPITGIKAGANISLGELYRRIGLKLVRSLGKKDMSLIDKQYINAVKLLRVPGYLHEESGNPAQYIDTDLKPAEFDPGIMDRAVLSRGFITSVVSSMVLAIEDSKPKRRVRRVKLGKLEEWSMVIKYMLNEGIRVNDGRIRFSYVLGNWCAARRMSIDKCRELHNRLVENANTREYQRYLEYGYNHPEYLPWPFTFFRGHEWYSVTDVDVFQDVYEALKGRVTKHVEVKHTPKPEVEPKQGEVGVKVEANTPNSNASTGKAEAGPGGHSSEGKAKPDEAEVEVKAEASPKPKPEVKVEAGAGVTPNSNTSKAEAAGSSTGGAKAPVGEATKTGAEANPKASEPKSKAEVDVGKIVELTMPWLEAAGYGELIGKLEPIIRRIVAYIIERGVVGEWELWDRFLNSVASATGSSGEAWLEMLFMEIITTIELIMEWLGVLKVEGNRLIYMGKAQGPVASEAKEPVVEVNTPNPNANNPPTTPEAKSTHNAEAVGNSHNPSVVGAEPSEPKTKTEAKANQGSQAGPATGAHWSGGKARINIGAYINHNDSPVEATAIRKSTVGTEAIEAPVRLTTVDAVAGGLCKTEECLVSARLAVIFTLNAVRSGPVRLRWLEGEFKSRYPTHYEALRESGVSILDIAAALKGLGVVVIGDVVVPGGWHPRWLAGLVKGILEDKGAVTASGLAVLIRKRERDLPSEFEGGLTLSDLVALAVRFLEWSGAVKIEDGFITLVNNK